jgi:hypothetical protein
MVAVPAAWMAPLSPFNSVLALACVLARGVCTAPRLAFSFLHFPAPRRKLRIVLPSAFGFALSDTFYTLPSIRFYWQ